MSQLNNIVKFLSQRQNRKVPGVTPAAIARGTGMNRTSVAKRIHDLREQGMEIYTNFRQVNGTKKTYYRLSV